MTIYTYKERNVKDFKDAIEKVRNKFKKYLSEDEMNKILKLSLDKPKHL